MKPTTKREQIAEALQRIGARLEETRYTPKGVKYRAVSGEHWATVETGRNTSAESVIQLLSINLRKP